MQELELHWAERVVDTGQRQVAGRLLQLPRLCSSTITPRSYLWALTLRVAVQWKKTTKKKKSRRWEIARGAGRRLANGQETYSSPSVELRYNKISPSFACIQDRFSTPIQRSGNLWKAQPASQNRKRALDGVTDSSRRRRRGDGDAGHAMECATLLANTGDFVRVLDLFTLC